MVKKKDPSEGFDFSEYSENDKVFESLPEVKGRQAKYRVYSTGCLMTDCAIGEIDPIMGNKGIPERTICEVYGRTASLKSNSAERLAKSVLESDPTNLVLIVYTEDSDLDRWNSIGVTDEMQERIIVLGCSDGKDVMLHLAEKNLDRVKIAVQDPRVKLVIIDSIKGLCTAKQLYTKKGEITALEDSEQLALRAKLIGEFIRDFKQLHKCAILYMTNQVSDKLSLSPADMYVNPQFTEQTPGGRAKEFECQLRIKHETRPIYYEAKHPLTDKLILRGWELTCRIIKNKFCRSTGNRVSIANFYFNPAGFNKIQEILTLGMYLSKIEKFPEDKKISKSVNGRWTLPKAATSVFAKDIRKHFADNPGLLEELEKAILENSEYIFAAPEEEEGDIF